MSIALPVLLLLIFVLAFWLVKESKLAVSLKVTAISLFFGFCAVFWYSMDSYMGWSAKDKYLPEIVTIRAVVVQEPRLQNLGGIYLLLQHPITKYENILFKVFGYTSEQSEPRLYKLPYTRGLHEQMQKDVIPRLQKGQSVTGKIGKRKGNNMDEGDGEESEDGKGKGKKGSGKGHGKAHQGAGSESLEQEYMFYKLEPSYFQRKEEAPAWDVIKP